MTISVKDHDIGTETFLYYLTKKSRVIENERHYYRVTYMVQIITNDDLPSWVSNRWSVVFEKRGSYLEGSVEGTELIDFRFRAI